MTDGEIDRSIVEDMDIALSPFDAEDLPSPVISNNYQSL
jgi:hypothetical protein